MLKNLHHLLTADLLHVLQSMGHGDELVLADRNYPAQSTARRLVRLDGADVGQAAAAILSVFPLDTFVEPPLLRMQVVGSPDEITPVQREFLGIAEAAEGRALAMGGLDRFAFYERARTAFAVVATSEARPYGCFVLVKGVIPSS